MQIPYRGESPIVSKFARDPDMADLVELFVSELPLKVDDLAEAMAAGNIDQIRTIAHQMKGSAAGYGFPSLGDVARDLEELVPHDVDEIAITRDISERIDELVRHCRRCVVHIDSTE